jgi:HEAT repeat protein
MKKKFVILTISLFALLLIFNDYAPAQTSQDPPLTKEQLEAFRSAKTVRILVQQSYGEAEGVSCRFFEKLTRKVLEDYAQCEVVGLDDEEFDLTIKINATGQALSKAYKYAYLQNKTTMYDYPRLFYPGATISGTIELEIQGIPPYTRTFSGVNEPPETLRDDSQYWPSKAPFEYLYWYFLPKLLEITGEIYGIDCIIAAQNESIRSDSIEMYFRGSAIKALKNIGDRAVEPMIAALNDENENVRIFAADVLGEIKDSRAVEPLITALRDENVEVREKTVSALGKIKHPRVLEFLIGALKDENSKVRVKAVEVLGEMKDPRVVEPLVAALNDENEKVRMLTAEVLGETKDPRVVEPLIIALNDENSEVRVKTLEALGKMKDSRALEPLIAALNDKSNDVRVASVKALGQMKDPRAAEDLIAKFKTRSESLREAVIEALSEFKDTRTIELLIATLDDKNWLMRWRAAEVLGNIEDPRVFEPLIAYLKDEKNIFIKGGEVAINILGDIKDPRIIEPLIAALKDADKGDQWWIVSTLKGLTEQDFDKNHEEWQKWWEENKEKFLEKEKKKGPGSFSLLFLKNWG